MSKRVRIVGRFDSHSGIGKHGISFIQALTATKNDLNIEAIVTNPSIAKENLDMLYNSHVTVTHANDVRGKSDIAVCCDVLTQMDSALYQLGKINALYFAWDSTQIPNNFVKIIRTTFDFVMVPSPFVKKTLVKSGVDKDILVLPLVVARPEILPVVQKDRFTFGFIGSYEKRKNVDLLIEAFLKALGNSADLRIHLTYSHEPDVLLQALCKKHQYSNVHISLGKLEQRRFFTVLNEIDCFISMSKGEGYSLLPREYMHLERPVILSHSSAHQSIAKMDGVWFIDAKIPYPAIYPQIDNQQHGVFHGPYLEDIVLALRDIWQEIKQKKRYPELAQYARTLSAESQSESYQTVIAPNRLIKSTFASHISPGYCLTLKSNTLIKKYGNDLLGDLPVNKHVVVANDGGFFSVFNRYVSILTHELEKNPQSIIIPDWRLSALIENIGHSHFTSFCYGTVEDGNIFLKIFDPPFDIPIDDYNNAEYLRDNAVLRTDYNEAKEPNLTYIHAYKLYKRKNFQSWRDRYHKHFSAHISLRPDLQQTIDTYKRQHFEGHYVIAAHIRHPSHAMEQPGGHLPTVEMFKKHIDRHIASASQTQDKPIKLFIASDQNSVIDYFSKHYPDILVTTHSTRTTAEHDKKYHSADSLDQQKESFQIQHIIAADKNRWSVKMADEVIIDTWLLAHSNLFIHITSNIATAVSFINPKVSMVYCE